MIDDTYDAGRSALLTTCELCVMTGSLTGLGVLAERSQGYGLADYGLILVVAILLCGLLTIVWPVVWWAEIIYALMRLPIHRVSGALILTVSITLFGLAGYMFSGIGEIKSHGRHSPFQAVALVVALGCGSCVTGFRLTFGKQVHKVDRGDSSGLKRSSHFTAACLIGASLACALYFLRTFSSPYPVTVYILSTGTITVLVRRLLVIATPPPTVNHRAYLMRFLYCGLAFGVPFGCLIGLLMGVVENAGVITGAYFGLGYGTVTFLVAGYVFANISVDL